MEFDFYYIPAYNEAVVWGRVREFLLDVALPSLLGIAAGAGPVWFTGDKQWVANIIWIVLVLGVLIYALCRHCYWESKKVETLLVALYDALLPDRSEDLRCSLLRPVKHKRFLDVHGSAESDGWLKWQKRVPVGKGTVGFAFEQQKEIYEPNILWNPETSMECTFEEGQARWGFDSSEIDEFRTKDRVSYWSIPIRNRANEVLAVLCVDSAKPRVAGTVPFRRDVVIRFLSSLKHVL